MNKTEFVSYISHLWRHADGEITRIICEQLTERAVELRPKNQYVKLPLNYACENNCYNFYQIYFSKMYYDLVDSGRSE